jgi:hypothetical protein
LTVSSSERVNIVSVLGGGWSALFVDRDQLPGYVIGVNDSAVLAKCHLCISMDRLWTEYRWQNLASLGRGALIRDAALKNIPEPRPKWLHPFECDYKSNTFSADETRLNGTNSGYCALNRAWQIRPRLVYLFGFDMNRSPNGNAYWYPPYPWAPQGATKAGKYDQWMREMDEAARQFKAADIDVVNVSNTSSIEVFRKITPQQFLKEPR